MTKQVTINIDLASVEALNASGMMLLAWKAVRTSQKTAEPLIFSVDTLATEMVVSYPHAMSAYTATAKTIAPNSVISPGFTTPIAPGQQLVLAANAGGGGTISAGGIPTAISIVNNTGIQYTGGLMTGQGGAAIAYCFAPIYGAATASFHPANKILLGLSSASCSPGMYLASLASTAGLARARTESNALVGTLLSVDLSTADTRAVNYNINTGWSFGDAAWATQHPATTPLASLLIIPDA